MYIYCSIISYDTKLLSIIDGEILMPELVTFVVTHHSGSHIPEQYLIYHRHNAVLN